MRRSTRDLAARQTQLHRLCGAERDVATQEAQDIAAGLARVDRVLQTAGRVATNPFVVAAGLTLIVVLSRSRLLRVIGAGMGMASAALRLAVPLMRLR